MKTLNSKVHKNSKSVIVINQEGTIIASYINAKVCSELMGISCTSLKRRLTGELSSTLNGYYFMYIKEEKVKKAIEELKEEKNG